MKIKRLAIKNYVGINELEWLPSAGVNVLEGVKGSGKTSILESIETAFTNSKRRTEVVRHGEAEATLYVETDTGLEIDRRIRTEKSDYMKLRQEGKAITSTEGELKKLISGDIFRPLDFVNMNIKDQTAIILNMIQINWSVEDINKWFGEEVEGINFDKHILQVLKDIEVKYYKEREDVNREINTLKVQCESVRKELPDEYDGEEWREKNIQEYYNKISESQTINNLIDKAQALKEGIETKIAAINSEAESQKSKVDIKYKEQEQDLKDIISLAGTKIAESKSYLENAEDKKSLVKSELTSKMLEEIETIKKSYNLRIEEEVAVIDSTLSEKHEVIEIQTNKITQKQSEIDALADKKQLEIEAIEKEKEHKIEAEKTRVGKASEYLDSNNVVDIAPLQEEAEQVAKMQSYIREWDKLKDIENNSLKVKLEHSENLTRKICIARTKPSDILKTHELPIDGISVDEKGSIRIGETLLDGLSDGEKLEVAFKVALNRMGELKVMCLDGFEKLNKSEQAKVLKICDENDIQAFVTIVEEKELEVK